MTKLEDIVLKPRALGWSWFVVLWARMRGKPHWKATIHGREFTTTDLEKVMKTLDKHKP